MLDFLRKLFANKGPFGGPDSPIYTRENIVTVLQTPKKKKITKTK